MVINNFCSLFHLTKLRKSVFYAVFGSSLLKRHGPLTLLDKNETCVIISVGLEFRLKCKFVRLNT